MNLIELVREALTDEKLEEVRSRIVRNVVEDQHGWVVHYTTPKDMRDAVLAAITPALEQAQRELDKHIPSACTHPTKCGFFGRPLEQAQRILDAGDD